VKDLNLREQAFLRAYSDPSSKTFGNGTASIKVAGYKVSSDKAASVYAVRLLGKDRVKEAIRSMSEQFELDFMKHVKTLDKKISALAESGKITREELQGYRLLGELAGAVGPKNQTNIQLNVGQECPVCHQVKERCMADIYNEMFASTDSAGRRMPFTPSNYLERIRDERLREAEQTTVSLPMESNKDVSTEVNKN